MVDPHRRCDPLRIAHAAAYRLSAYTLSVGIALLWPVAGHKTLPGLAVVTILMPRYRASLHRFIGTGTSMLEAIIAMSVVLTPSALMVLWLVWRAS
jgi:hypothetical protein